MDGQDLLSAALDECGLGDLDFLSSDPVRAFRTSIWRNVSNFHCFSNCRLFTMKRRLSLRMVMPITLIHLLSTRRLSTRRYCQWNSQWKFHQTEMSSISRPSSICMSIPASCRLKINYLPLRPPQPPQPLPLHSTVATSFPRRPSRQLNKRSKW